MVSHGYIRVVNLSGWSLFIRHPLQSRRPPGSGAVPPHSPSLGPAFAAAPGSALNPPALPWGSFWPTSPRLFLERRVREWRHELCDRCTSCQITEEGDSEGVKTRIVRAYFIFIFN